MATFHSPLRATRSGELEGIGSTFAVYISRMTHIFQRRNKGIVKSSVRGINDNESGIDLKRESLEVNGDH